jgi:Histidine phosphatase superfamily (branch 2)
MRSKEKEKSFSSWFSRYSIIAVVVIVVIFFAVESTLYDTISSTDGNDFHKQSFREQPMISPSGDLMYCNTHEVTGSEGTAFTGSQNWVLHHLLLNIRHGDRSSIHNIPEAQKLSDQVSKHVYLDQAALQYVPRLNSFVLEPIGSGKPGTVNSEGDLPDALNVSAVFDRSDKDLAPGILTTRGFMQHILLGKYIAHAYKDFIGTIKSHDDLYVRSTNYRRTILSVSALLVSLSSPGTYVLAN